jgi:tRNA-2-methylthio-N6-dimethylallyladenosine synthase
MNYKGNKEYIELVCELNRKSEHGFLIETFGCQLNENESEKLAGMCLDMGYKKTGKMEDADLVILNTCCVRENAENKVYGHLGILKKLKQDNPELVIAVCGCMMQQEQIVEHIKNSYRHVDLVFGTHNLYMLPELLHKVLGHKERVYEILTDREHIVEGIPMDRQNSVSAWVTVIYGCNNYCSYCIVPYVRGREISRDPGNIINEVKTIAQHDIKEITLLGQNVNSYGRDISENLDFSDLLYRVNGVSGIERIRFMTSHPKDLSDRLIEAIKKCSKVCEHIHLPIQSGSTEVLRKMNRKYTREHYMMLVEKIKTSIPDVSLTTDIIVGFPGETDDDFEQTIDLIEKAGYDSSYTFLFSKRTGTPAADYTNQVPEEIKNKRFKKLLDVQNRISLEKNRALINRVLEVLVEGKSKNNPDAYTGRTRTNKIVNFKSKRDLTGKLVNIKIDKALTWSLEGTIFV